MNFYLSRFLFLIAPVVPAVAATNPTFEAASLKLYENPFHQVGAGQGRLASIPRFRHEGGPGTDDPGRIHYIQFLTGLLAGAFEVRPQQVRLPSTFDQGVFEVNATLPPGATVHEANLMLRELLITRFGIQYHQEKTRTAGFAIVAAKHGATISSAGVPKGTAKSPISYGADGRPTPALIGIAGIRRVEENAGWSVIFEQQTMSQLAAYLADRYRVPVMDSTGLTGRYDFLLRFYPPEWGIPVDPIPGVKYFRPLRSVMQRQLGVKLVSKKQEGPLIVIDKIAMDPIVD